MRFSYLILVYFKINHLKSIFKIEGLWLISSWKQNIKAKIIIFIYNLVMALKSSKKKYFRNNYRHFICRYNSSKLVTLCAKKLLKLKIHYFFILHFKKYYVIKYISILNLMNMCASLINRTYLKYKTEKLPQCIW